MNTHVMILFVFSLFVYEFSLCSLAVKMRTSIVIWKRKSRIKDTLPKANHVKTSYRIKIVVWPNEFQKYMFHYCPWRTVILKCPALKSQKNVISTRNLKLTILITITQFTQGNGRSLLTTKTKEEDNSNTIFQNIGEHHLTHKSFNPTSFTGIVL